MGVERAGVNILGVSECHILRSLINVHSLIIVQGVTLFYKRFTVSSGLWLFPFLRAGALGPRDSKKSKLSHLENYLVVLEQLTGL